MAHGSALTSTLGVVYLARSADGVDKFERFAKSYRKYPPGIAHDLVVLYKGFTDNGKLLAARALFSDIDHIALDLNDEGFDIGSYSEACRRVNYTTLCFLNTHSEILADGWLVLMARHCRNGVGLVGAMGSYESIANSVPMLERAIRTAQHPGAGAHAELARYFDFLLQPYRPEWYTSAPVKPSLNFFQRIAADLTASRARAADRRRGPRGTALIWPGAPELNEQAFPSFPNPHIRSNGFLIARETFLGLSQTFMHTKADANVFESGHDSLTNRVLRLGLGVRMVGRDGNAYDIPEWHRCRGFRISDQVDLLIGDNHTRTFASMSEHGRSTHERMTWGDYLRAAPTDFPLMKINFPINHRRVAVAGSIAGTINSSEWSR